MRPKNQNTMGQRKKCWFCENNVHVIDYKDPVFLRKFCSSYGKIAPRRRSGVCSPHQRRLSTAVKRARIMALLPFLVR